MKDDKSINLIAKKLQSGSKDEVLFTIKQLRNTGSPKIIPFVIDLLNTTESDEVKSSIISLLGDLKDKRCTTEIVAAINNDKFKTIRKDILSTCWQSGLDYSNHLALFVDLFISEKFVVAFEAFTILDNFEDKYEAGVIEPIINKLKLSTLEFKGTDKEALFVELVHILERLRL